MRRILYHHYSRINSVDGLCVEAQRQGQRKGPRAFLPSGPKFQSTYSRSCVRQGTDAGNRDCLNNVEPEARSSSSAGARLEPVPTRRPDEHYGRDYIMKRNLVIIALLLATTFFWIPAGSDLDAQDRENNGQRRDGDRGRKNTHGYRNYGQYRRTRGGHRRYRLRRRYYYRRGIRLSRFIRIYY
jgi:hypothetical protein